MTEATAHREAHDVLDSEMAARLRHAASAAATWDVIHHPQGHSSFRKRVHKASEALRQLEIKLARQSIADVPTDADLLARRSAFLELGANQRMLRTAVTAVADKPGRVAKLPRIVRGHRQEEPRAAAIAQSYIHTVGGIFSASTFHTFIHALQKHEPLNIDELWSIGGFVQFILLELILDEARALLHSSDAAAVPRLMVYLKSLRSISHADWVYLIEPLIALDALLRQDPAKAFADMDFETRELYRRRIAFIARHSDCSESEVAKIALHLARHDRERPGDDPRAHRRRMHIGYYLIDEGFPQLAKQVGFHPSFTWRARALVRASGEEFFVGGIQILTAIFMAAVLFPVLPAISSFLGVAAIVFFVFLPATQDAVDLMNSAITAFFDPEPLPKMNFSDGIPDECATLVAVPTLLLNEKQARKLVNDLEVRFLANRDPNLHFALLTDLADSVSRPREKDSHALVELVTGLIDELNAKYQSGRNGAFLLLHRHRIYNARQGVWMGWERKRGKLLDLNKFLAGSFDAFPAKAGPVDVLSGVRYILTVDSDTQLPSGEAARLAGAIAHPLNQAIIHPKLRRVTTGFGILQPRMGVAVRSTARSRLAAIYSGHTGFDIYTRAISDAYQDLFGEGIFTGKGIYEAAILHAVLEHRFPRNALLSHDLIEGAYARAGLATDIELVDDYPSHYSAYMRRKHRWVRGDWQIVQWMFSRVPDESGHWATNPISNISRWKIFDNLRRSLVDPFLLMLFAAGWLRLPGGPVYWTLVALLMLFFPAAAQLAFGLGRALLSGNKGQAGEVLSGVWRAFFVALLHLAFLPHETMLAIDAIVRSLIRRFITGERLLEWETASQAELRTAHSAVVDHYLAATPLVAAGLGALIWFLAGQHRAIFCAAPLLVLWALANPITVWLNRPPRDEHRLNPVDREFLTMHALRIWRYFQEFGIARHNYLIPDNVMEEGLREAARVSPTNIGLLLNARQAACELGFLTAPEFAALTHGSLVSIERMEKFRGHLYNWYDTKTLCPLDQTSFVSSVDSGNLAASLYTLQSGTHVLAGKPLLNPELFAGIRALAHLLRAKKQLPAALSKDFRPPVSVDLAEWMEWLPAAQDTLTSEAALADEQDPDACWVREASNRVHAILTLIQDYLPWTWPEFKPLCDFLQLARDANLAGLSPIDALAFAEDLQAKLRDTQQAADGNLPELAQRLDGMLIAAIGNLRILVEQLRGIEQDAERLIEAMDFSFLVDPNRQILSIGYEAGKQRRHEACYDMIASEASVATLLAIARGDLSRQSWHKLGRDHVLAYGHFLLLSWSGTMFEYLMPALWMRSYPGTLLARTQEAVVYVQRAFGRSLRIPWGISESGSARKDDCGNYEYFAYGIPRIALNLEAKAGPVISPYSTFLALAVDPKQTIKNLRRMEAAGWVGAYGFYESADYSASSRSPDLTREWMAHHEGMALLAITNLLLNNVVQQWFHRHPQIQAAEMLLQEAPLSKAILKARWSEVARR